jgi:hypothetical protein
MLVRIVIASSLGSTDLEFLASSRTSAAARIISSPPRACTSNNCTPGNAMALVTAPLTVFGISWNFKSRKMPGPSWFNFCIAEGPSAVNKCIFILKMPINEERDWASSNAGSRDGKSSARISFWRARSLRDVLAPRAAQLVTAYSHCPRCQVGKRPGRRHPGRDRR